MIQDEQIKERVSQCFIVFRNTTQQHTNAKFRQRHTDTSEMLFCVTTASIKSLAFCLHAFPDLKHIGVFTTPTIAAFLPIENVSFHVMN